MDATECLVSVVPEPQQPYGDPQSKPRRWISLTLSGNTIAQEAYRWSTTAEATRRIMNIRYSLLPYTYTLFHRANVAGETVLRALPWEFPNDPSLKAVETQFMSGPALLVTPVLAPLATSVQGVFPGIADGTLWYDFYTLQKVSVAAGENKTLDPPLVHQPIHVRGGYIVPMQKAGNTTKTSRLSPWSLIVALDGNGKAGGELYLDDGISLVPNATKNVEVGLCTDQSACHDIADVCVVLVCQQHASREGIRRLPRRDLIGEHYDCRHQVEAATGLP